MRDKNTRRERKRKLEREIKNKENDINKDKESLCIKTKK